MSINRLLIFAFFVAAAGVPGAALTQSPIEGRVNILLAAYRGATTAADLAVIRAGVRSRDPQTARIAIRALGRLERPSAIADLAPSLKSPLPELRAEAADAIAQSARSADRSSSVFALLSGRLEIEPDADVRAVLCESLGRLPYASTSEAARAEDSILGLLSRETGVMDRLGAAKGLEALGRRNRSIRPLGARAIASLRSLFGRRSDPPRVRRLALLALMNAAEGGVIADDLIAQGAGDPDMQVRRLAVRAARSARSDVGLAIVDQARQDQAPMVRSEAANATDDLPSRSPESGADRGANIQGPSAIPPPLVTVQEVERFESARARLTVRNVGTIELALFTSEAPASVLRFVRLAQAGFFNSVLFERPTPDLVVRTRGPEGSSGGPLPAESGPWPHVRGSVGFAAGRSASDARIAIQMTDDPSLDHEQAVFGQVLTGIDVVDRLREGDVIEKIDILAH
jgi:peptidyl-prolyl cis-trans isomerase B (cyclophilin B)